MAMATDDFSFSFPITPSHSPMDSPPLWTLSPEASPAYRIPIRRLRLIGADSDTQEDDEENREEEMMGMMWEAWNEELSKHRRQIMMDLHSTNPKNKSKTPDPIAVKKLFLLHQSASKKRSR